MKSKYFDSLSISRGPKTAVNPICSIYRSSLYFVVEIASVKYMFERIESVCDFIRSNIG